jgi:phage tail-like protein
VKAPTQHALLRDRRRWLGNASGLAIDRDGAFMLLRVPGPSDGKPVEIASSYPAPREVSGLALGPCARVFVADTAHDRVLLVEPQCKSQAWLHGFKSPRGLTLGDEALLVADSGHQRVQGVALPALEAHWAPVQGLTATSVAVDSQQRLVFVDATSQTVRRVSRLGVPDTAFDNAILASARLATPLFVAVGAEDAVLVSDGAHDRVDVFDADGTHALALAGPSGWLPGALAAGAGRLYVADAADGRILVFDAAGALQGAVSGWRGPVTALALDADGDLYIKPGLDARYLQFSADAAHVDSGMLLAGPFDAGEQRAWERAWVEANTPVGTSVAVEVAQAKKATPAPTAGDWKALPGTDALLAPLLPALAERRHLWLRITLATTQARSTPVLRQARAATEAEDLREHLPMTYRRNDPAAVLERLLQLLRGEFIAVEERIDDMPRVADPQFAPGSSLNWLAQWLALELPQIAGDDERRALIARAVALFARRGSPAAIAEFVALHTGVRPAIVESFAQRRLWVLGASSQLGFDTQLPPMDPLGMVVPDPQAAEGCCPLADGEPVIGRAVVGDSGPLAAHQIGLPLFEDEAYRFCVVVDGYRVHDRATLQELQRIVEREKPAHTDYRVEVVAPELRIGLQALVGVDTIVGGAAPPWQLAGRQLGFDARLMPPDAAARMGDALIDGSLRLT